MFFTMCGLIKQDVVLYGILYIPVMWLNYAVNSPTSHIWLKSAILFKPCVVQLSHMAYCMVFLHI